VERCSPSLVQGIVHLWHHDALDSLDTYFGNISRFAETRKGLWITASRLSQEDELHFREGNNRKNADFPPLSVLTGEAKKSLKQKGGKRPCVEERCLSLVITGDPFGHSWACSLWSSITKASRVEEHIESSLPKLQHFIHQPATGRCIFFIILLGHICETLAVKYRQILTRLDKIVELGVRTLLLLLVYC
jgi:hypothetical protein